MFKSKIHVCVNLYEIRLSGVDDVRAKSLQNTVFIKKGTFLGTGCIPNRRGLEDLFLTKIISYSLKLSCILLKQEFVLQLLQNDL